MFIYIIYIHIYVKYVDVDKYIKSNMGNMQRNEKNFEETRSLSPIEEESESTLCFKETFQSNNFDESEGRDYKMIRSPYKGCQMTLRKVDGNKEVTLCELRENRIP